MLGPKPSKNLWYIPTSRDSTRDHLAEAENAAAELKKLYGLSQIACFDLRALTPTELRRRLHAFPIDAIYVASGNTYYLNYYLKVSGAREIVLDRINAGVVYVGSSAGTINAGGTVQTALYKNWDDQTAQGRIPDTDWRDPTVASGLDLCAGRSFLPHADGPYAVQTWQEEQCRLHGHSPQDIVALADATGFVQCGDDMGVI